MTQKGNLFKGQKKKKTIPPNHHGKVPQIRKGKRFVKPSNFSKEMDTDRLFSSVFDDALWGKRHVLLLSVYQVDAELSKFINHCNEMKAASLANKEGGQLTIVKPPSDSSNSEQK